MARNKVEISGVDTSKLPVLTNEEMRELFRAYQAGDRSAREKLVNGNLRLVLSVIQRFNNRGEIANDLFQVGCIGLMKAIDNFDLGQNVKFSTYAVPMIIGEIRRYLRDNNPIRVSRSLRDIAYKALQVRDPLTNRYSREPTIMEIAEAMGVSKEEVVFALDAIQDPVSLFEPIYQDGGDPIYVMDQFSDDRQQGHSLGGKDCSPGSDEQIERPGKGDFIHAIFRGKNADGGGGGDRHFPGAGLPLGERRPSSKCRNISERLVRLCRPGNRKAVFRLDSARR